MLRTLLLWFSGIALQVASQSGVPPSATVRTAVIDLLDAGHILHFLDVLDAFGHVSVRNPDNSSQFLMSFSLAPALATSQSIVTYAIDNATALQLTFDPTVTGANVPQGFSERFIHSQIYSTFPDVISVVHGHTPEVLPFAGANVTLKAQLHNAGSIGTTGTPIFDFGKLPPSVVPDDQLHDLRIRNEAIGNALANTFSNDSQVVLMLNHGMAVRGASIREVVFLSFYTMHDATVQLQGTQLGNGREPMGLTAQQAADAITTTNTATILGRAWQLWVAQIDHDGFYTNDLRNGAPPTLGK